MGADGSLLPSQGGILSYLFFIAYFIAYFYCLFLLFSRHNGDKKVMPNALETPWVTLEVNDVPLSLCNDLGRPNLKTEFLHTC